MPLLCVVAVALQQGGAVAGEVSMGKAVIGHDALRLVVEKSNMARFRLNKEDYFTLQLRL